MPDQPDPFIAAASMEGVPSAFSATRDGIDAVLRDRGLRRSTPQDTAESLLIGAAATAQLEGDVVTPEELAQGAGGPTARGALRMSGELLGLLPDWRRAPVQVIARLHALAAAGTEPDEDLGRPTNSAGAARLQELGRLLTFSTRAPGLVVAALLHAEIATADAFTSHNGVVARAVERLVLVSTGVDPASVIVPEAGHAAAPNKYQQALAEYREADEAGVQAWLTYAAGAFSFGAETSPLARPAT